MAGATDYTLWVGTTAGAQDALNFSSATAVSTTASLQPGTTYYATLWTKTAAGSSTSTSTFQTAGEAVITSPANGAANLDPGAPISVTWSGVSGTAQYELLLGSSVGASDYYTSGTLSATSVTVTMKPNTKYYARLMTTIDGGTTFSDSAFATGDALAHFTYPVSGTSGVNQFQPLAWTAAQGASSYYLVVSPTNYDVFDFYASGTLIPGVTSEYVPGLLPNTTYYAELCTGTTNGEGCTYSTFITGDGPGPTSKNPSNFLPSNRAAFYEEVKSLTAQVRLMANYPSNVPITGSALYTEIANLGSIPSQGASCLDFAFTLLNIFTNNQILARQRGLSLQGMINHDLTEYWDPFNATWQVADPTFGLVYFNNGSQIGQSADEIGNLLNSGNLASITALYVTGYGSQYMVGYYVDPITLFANVQPFGLLDTEPQLDYVPNSPLAYLNLVSSPGAAGLYTFNFAGPADSITITQGTTTISVAPGNSEGWSGPYSLSSGWTISSPVPNDMTMYTPKWIENYSSVSIDSTWETSTAPALELPASGATVAPNNVLLNWDSAPGAKDYTLLIGTSPGASDAYQFTSASATSAIVNLQPETTYYTTLLTETSSGNPSTTSTFSTTPATYLLAPSSGAMVMPGNVQFSWVAVPETINDTLWVGTTPNAYDALYFTSPNALSTTANLQPRTTYYATMWTLTAAGYNTTTSTFQTSSMPANGHED